MKEYANKPESQSRTLDSNPRASKQAPIADILQAYKNGILGRQPVQCEGVEDEEILQTKTSGQTPASVILQQYKESIQRYAPEENDELLQGKFDTTQREEINEEELIQGKFDSTSTKEQEPIQREEKPNNTGLPNNLKTGLENLSGYSMDDVKVHYNSSKPMLLNALAYAQGTDIHIAPGQEKHLPHEAWHVVQQKQGRVQSTMQLQGVNVNDNETLEKEADMMEGKAHELMVNKSSIQHLKLSNSSRIDVLPVQRMKFSRFRWMQNPINWGWKHNEKEKELLSIEKKLKNTLTALRPYSKGLFGDSILQIAGSFHFLSEDEYEESQYDDVLKDMTDLLGSAQDIECKISSTDLNDGHIKRALTTNVGKGPLAKEVVTELLTLYDALPGVMRIPKNKELIKKAIYPDVQRNEGFYNEDMGTSTVTFARSRSKLLTKNFNQLNARIEQEWPTIRENFNIDGDIKEIELTGSDFHNLGQQVAIVKSTTEKKIVYKPRSVSPDDNLIGEKGVFHDLNVLSKGSVQLPTMKFMETKDDDGSFSFVEYQQKAMVQSIAQVHEYYERFGELTVASKLLGVNDLHYENIMSTSKTPTIIDAETAFLPFVMEAESFAKTELGMSLNSFKEASENFFYTPEEKEAHDPQRDGDFITYIANLRHQDLNGQKNYMLDFERGMDNVINLVKTQKDIIVKTLLEKMKNVKNIRVVPFKTRDFQDSITTYQSLLITECFSDADLVVVQDVTKMKKALIQKGFSVFSDYWDPSITSKVGKFLKADYNSQDTPILHFDPFRNELLFHSQDIGCHSEWEMGKKEFITRIVNRIIYANKDKIKADLGISN